MTILTERKGQARGMLLAGIAVLTVGLLIGMKFFLNDDSAAVSEEPAGGEPLFKGSSGGTPPPGLNPATRSETGSGGGLEMFGKTNAGYYGEEESTAAVTAAAAPEPEVKKSTAPAVKKAVAKAKAKVKTTVIPRMQSSSFGRTSPTSVAPHGAGQSMPDISNMIKQAQDQVGKQKSSGN